MNDLPAGINEHGVHTGTIRHFRCQSCGRDNEVRLKGLVPSSHYNAVVYYVREAAGNNFVLLPVSTLNAMGEERDRLAAELRQRQ